MHRAIFVSIAALIFLTGAINAQNGYRGIAPGTSTKLQAERILGSPVKKVSETLSEYAADGDVSKIYVQYRAEADIVERIELLYDEGVAKTEIVAKLKLPAESGWKVNARNKLEEYYAGRNVVLTFDGDGSESGVRRIGYYSSELFATILPSDGAKPAGTAADRGSTRTSVVGMPEPPSEWMRAAPIDGSNVVTMRQDTSNANLNRSETVKPIATASAPLAAYAGVYEFRSQSTPAGLATGKVEVDGDRLIWKSRYISGALIRIGGGSQMDRDGVLVKKFTTFRFVDNEDIRLQFTIDNGQVLEVGFSDLSSAKSFSTIGFRRR